MEHVIIVKDESVVDFMVKKDGIDKDNTTFIQRIFDGHETEWAKMKKVVDDRGEAGQLLDRLQRADEVTKAQVIAILEAAAKPIEEEIIP